MFQFNKSVPGEPCSIDPDNDDHEAYLSEFKSMVMAKMRNSIDKDLVNDPDIIKGRKKTVQVNSLSLPFKMYFLFYKDVSIVYRIINVNNCDLITILNCNCENNRLIE